MNNNRMQMLVGQDNMDLLNSKTVAVFGLGGVGGYAVEALARANIGRLILIDNDIVNQTNINRQILALNSTVGQLKTVVARQRVSDINATTEVLTHNTFVDKTNISEFQFANFDYVVDAIDTVASKILLVQHCIDNGTPIISCMGTGNKLDAGLLTVCDLFKTHTCPLAKVMRKELASRGIRQLNVVYSPEQPRQPLFQPQDSAKRCTPSSISYVPGVAGLLMANKVIADLLHEKLH